MIVSNIDNFINMKENTKKLLNEGLNYIKNLDFNNLKVGVYNLKNDELIMQVQEYYTDYEKNIDFESHKYYLDVHYIIDGEERILISNENNPPITVEYDKDRDIIFYDSNIGVLYDNYLKKGDFIVTSVNELHKTRCAVKNSTFVRKIVLKIKEI